jgi:hypothetical protein
VNVSLHSQLNHRLQRFIHRETPVMAGLVPAIHAFFLNEQKKDVDARHKPAHDDWGHPRMKRMIPEKLLRRLDREDAGESIPH